MCKKTRSEVFYLCKCNQDQSNEIEMEDEAKDLFVHMRMTEEEEAIKAFSMYNIHKQFSCIMLIIYF